MACVIHVAGSSLEHGEGCVPFIQVTDLGMYAENAKQSPAPDAEYVFLS